MNFIAYIIEETSLQKKKESGNWKSKELNFTKKKDKKSCGYGKRNKKKIVHQQTKQIRSFKMFAWNNWQEKQNQQRYC